MSNEPPSKEQAGFRRARATADKSGEVAQSRSVSGGSGTPSESKSRKRPALVESDREARDGGLKEGRARRKTARLERGPTEKVGGPFARGPGEGRIFEWIVDARSDRTTDPPTLSSEVSLRSRVVDSTPEIGLELPASGRPCTRAERSGYPRLEGKYLARS